MIKQSLFCLLILFGLTAVANGQSCWGGYTPSTNALDCEPGWQPGDFDVASSEFGGNSISGWALKAAPPIWDGSNESGFEAVKTGYRNHNGTFVYDHAVFWTTDLHNSFYGVNRFLTTQSASLSAAAEEFTNGHSIRCIKDTEE